MRGKDKCVYKGGLCYNILAFITSLFSVSSFLEYFVSLKLALLNSFSIFFQIVTIILKKISSFSRCYKWKTGFRMNDGNRQKQNTFYWYIMNTN